MNKRSNTARGIGSAPSPGRTLLRSRGCRCKSPQYQNHTAGERPSFSGALRFAARHENGCPAIFRSSIIRASLARCSYFYRAPGGALWPA